MAETKKCPKCGVKLPLSNKKGNHNFCPALLKGEIRDVCMRCKIKMIEKK